MDFALETVTVEATAPGASAAFAAVAGNSLTIRDAKAAELLSVSGARQTAGFFQLTSPLLHDAVVGIQGNFETNAVAWFQNATPQPLNPQDTLTATGSGSGTAGDIEQNSIQVFYENLAGICANLIMPADVRSRGIEWYCSQNTITAGTTGGYSGEELLDADQDQLKANQEYAILGITLRDADTLSVVRYRSPDWGNLGIGVPAAQNQAVFSSRYFAFLSEQTGRPCIPVFNASQKDSVFIDVANNENALTPIVITHMVRLRGTRKIGK